MADLIKIQCPQCQAIHSVAADYLYKKVRCPKCNFNFVAYDDITPPKPVSTPIEKPNIPGQSNKEVWIVLVSLLCIGIAVFLYYNSPLTKKKCVFSEAQKQLIRNAMTEATILKGLILSGINSELQEKKLEAALQALDELNSLPDKDFPDIMDMSVRISTLKSPGDLLCWDAGLCRLQIQNNDLTGYKETLDQVCKHHDEFHQNCLKLLQDR